jgi:hypothetical protein
MAKPTKVKLVNGKGFERDFLIEHAQNLLTYEANKKFNNWSISAKSPFTFSNGIIERTNSGTDRKTGKSGKAIKGQEDTGKA